MSSYTSMRSGSSQSSSVSPAALSGLCFWGGWRGEPVAALFVPPPLPIHTPPGLPVVLFAPPLDRRPACRHVSVVAHCSGGLRKRAACQAADCQTSHVELRSQTWRLRCYFVWAAVGRCSPHGAQFKPLAKAHGAWEGMMME